MVLNFCTLSHIIALYLHQVSRKYFKGFLYYWAETISILKFSKGHNSIKMQAELCFLISAYCLIVLHICSKLQENISKGFRVIKWTQMSY